MMTTSTANSPLLNVTEAADYLRCSASHLNKLRVTDGGPIFVKIGARVLYTRADLNRFINQKRHKSTAEHKAA
jgi:excisionase family DNA binding protein